MLWAGVERILGKGKYLSFTNEMVNGSYKPDKVSVLPLFSFPFYICTAREWGAKTFNFTDIQSPLLFQGVHHAGEIT